MPAERDNRPLRESPWWEAADLARFVAEAAALSGAVLLAVWLLR